MDYDWLHNSSITLQKKNCASLSRSAARVGACNCIFVFLSVLYYFKKILAVFICLFGVRRMANETNPGWTRRWTRSKAARHGQSYKAHARGRWLRTLPMSWCLDLRLVCCFTLSNWVATFSSFFVFKKNKNIFHREHERWRRNSVHWQQNKFDFQGADSVWGNLVLCWYWKVHGCFSQRWVCRPRGDTAFSNVYNQVSTPVILLSWDKTFQYFITFKTLWNIFNCKIF